MIKFVEGDFFDYDADVRINTVNCVGVMGAGVALAFKDKYPAMFKEYVRQCKAKEITPGNPTVWKEGDMFSKGIEIINFPTKDHWRKPSKYEYIESGLIWLSKYLENRKNLTVTLPALGCGHGGLDWSKVKSLIEKHLRNTSNKILVFEPSASKNSAKKKNLSQERTTDLNRLGVKILDKSSRQYPTKLMRYTEKNLYALGEMKTEFDVSLISSTKPSLDEQEVIAKFIEHCRINDISILFGGTSFDKQMAAFSIKKGIKSGVFLPSGIFNSAKKMNLNGGAENVTVLSIGDPFTSFDKKEYMPSVLSRIFISKYVLFTTTKLSWMKNKRKVFLNNNIDSYFINYKNINKEDYLSAKISSAKPINYIEGKLSFGDLIIK